MERTETLSVEISRQGQHHFAYWFLPKGFREISGISASVQPGAGSQSTFNRPMGSVRAGLLQLSWPGKGGVFFNQEVDWPGRYGTDFFTHGWKDPSLCGRPEPWFCARPHEPLSIAVSPKSTVLLLSYRDLLGAHYGINAGYLLTLYLHGHD